MLSVTSWIISVNLQLHLDSYVKQYVEPIHQLCEKSLCRAICTYNWIVNQNCKCVKDVLMTIAKQEECLALKGRE